MRPSKEYNNSEKCRKYCSNLHIVYYVLKENIPVLSKFDDIYNDKVLGIKLYWYNSNQYLTVCKLYSN